GGASLAEPVSEGAPGDDDPLPRERELEGRWRGDIGVAGVDPPRDAARQAAGVEPQLRQCVAEWPAIEVQPAILSQPGGELLDDDEPGPDTALGRASAAEGGLAGLAPVQTEAAAGPDERNALDEGPHHEVAVVVDTGRGIPGSGAVEAGAGPHDRGGRVVPAAEPVAEIIEAARARVAGGWAADPPVAGEFEALPGADGDHGAVEAGGGGGSERLAQALDGIRRQDIVCIEEHEQVAAGEGSASVAGGGSAVERALLDAEVDVGALLAAAGDGDRVV